MLDAAKFAQRPRIENEARVDFEIVVDLDLVNRVFLVRFKKVLILLFQNPFFIFVAFLSQNWDLDQGPQKFIDPLLYFLFSQVHA